jgi:hypothetical protein
MARVDPAALIAAPGLYSPRAASRVCGGAWKEIDERGVLAAVIELAPLNRASHAGDRGSINRPKARPA